MRLSDTQNIFSKSVVLPPWGRGVIVFTLMVLGLMSPFCFFEAMLLGADIPVGLAFLSAVMGCGPPIFALIGFFFLRRWAIRLMALWCLFGILGGIRSGDAAGAVVFAVLVLLPCLASGWVIERMHSEGFDVPRRGGLNPDAVPSCRNASRQTEGTSRNSANEYCTYCRSPLHGGEDTCESCSAPVEQSNLPQLLRLGVRPFKSGRSQPVGWSLLFTGFMGALLGAFLLFSLWNEPIGVDVLLGLLLVVGGLYLAVLGLRPLMNKQLNEEN